jgi:tRNA threonylcarbamoyladenosine biosynthesis protein TsaB
MPLILNIETSENICSVALSKNNEIIAIKESSEEHSHSKLITVFIDELFKNSKYKITDLDAVAVTKGPGSYTGLRIGVSTAKGLCYGLNIPLIAIGTLNALANAINKLKITENYLICPIIDARRMEVYSAIFDKNLNIIEDVSANILTEQSYQNYLNTNKVIFVGSGCEKFNAILNNKNAQFNQNIKPSATNMVELSTKKFENKEFENLAYFEPYYLKDFIAIKSKNKIF